MNNDIARIREALQFIPASDRGAWVKAGMGIKSELGDSGFDLWESWSQQDESFDPKAARVVWKSIKAGGKIGIGSLFHDAKAHGWRDDDTHQKPTAEDMAEHRRNAAERAAQEQAKTASENAEAKKKSLLVWQAASEAKADLPYLPRKQVSPVATMREIDASAAAAILGYAPKSNGELLTGRLLVIPVKVGNALSTLELIDGEGRKSAVYGGAKAGGYWAAQTLPDCDGPEPLVIGEGVATVLSGKDASGNLSIAALSSGNLAAVALAMRQLYPTRPLIVLADLVRATGAPDTHAIEAARAVGGLLALPDFGGNRPDDATDFNDMAQLCGTAVVQKAIASAKVPVNADHQASDEDAPESDSDGWPEPQPLAAKITPEPYPFDALPEVLRAAVEEVAGFVKAPIPMVASCAVSALSLAIQAHVDVKRAEKLTGPVSAYWLIIADSGERKSTCDNFFSKAIRDYEARQAEAAKPILKNYRAECEVWEAKRGGIKDKIRQLVFNCINIHY